MRSLVAVWSKLLTFKSINNCLPTTKRPTHPAAAGIDLAKRARRVGTDFGTQLSGTGWQTHTSIAALGAAMVNYPDSSRCGMGRWSYDSIREVRHKEMPHCSRRSTGRLHEALALTDKVAATALAWHAGAQIPSH
jgi:hypothetical protein